MKIRRQSNSNRSVVFGRLSIALGIVVLLGSSQSALAQWTTNGNNVTNTNSGNVGVGTSNPTWGKLQVNKSIRIDDDTASPTGSDTLGGAANLYFGTTTGGNLFQYNSGGGLDLWQYNSGWFQTVTFSKIGNVGIGTTAPTAKLHVAGDGRVTGNLIVDGNIAAKYQDVAEWVPSTRALPAGTVVTLSPTKSNLVEPSAKAYDTRVAGVISERPGIALGERGENKLLVATTGRVRIKVDATHAPIEIGDLLVTSDKEGIAMKSMPLDLGGVQIHRPGTLIGKALEPLQKGTGEILVLLSLQ